MNLSSITQHYGALDLVSPLEEALQQAGFKDTDRLDWETLAPLDQFHVGGAAATRDLIAHLDLMPGRSVLDVGCGLGGPARQLAASCAVSVQGVDLNASFIDVANMLTRRCGQSALVSHVTGDATQLPFAAEQFDAAWTQHVAMNIEDRARFYRGIIEVLRPGGRFALYDVVARGSQPVHFPVPWAGRPADSFLLSAEATRAALENAGFVVRHWRDATASAMSWQKALAEASTQRPSALRRIALPLVMGPAFPEMVANLGRSFQEQRVALLQAVVERPAGPAQPGSIDEPQAVTRRGS